MIVHRPPERVFRWIADPERASRWQPDVGAYEVTRTCDGIVGTEFRETLVGRGGSAEMTGRISAYRPDELIAFDLSGPGVDVHARYRADPAPTGSTVEGDVELTPTAALPRLVRPVVRWRMRRQLVRELATLRRLCEAEADD